MLKITDSELEKIAAIPKQYPEGELPEIAFAGRSNVGKSSFINSVINRKNLARTSSKPGKTRTVNFYLINKGFRLVDLPGYGYAQVSKAEKEKWGKYIEDYLYTRENLKEVVLLVDIRHTPSDDDLTMYKWIIDAGFSGYVIATKADKISRGSYQKAKKQIAEKLEIKDREKIFCYSSEKKTNIEELLTLIEEIIGQ